MTYDSYAYPIIKPEENFIRQHDRYLYIRGLKDYSIPASREARPDYSATSSIDTILEQDTQALLDKVVNTSFSIVYRLRIYNDIKKTLDYNRLKTSSRLSQLYDWIPGVNANVERRKSMLIKELHTIDKQRLEEKIACWKDLTEPTQYFVQLFHKHKELKQDKKLLNEKS